MAGPASEVRERAAPRTPGRDREHGREVIGIDFDNTIVSYDAVFLGEARKRGLVSGAMLPDKKAIRDAIRLLQRGEDLWQQLQGYVYGRGISGAVIFDGVDGFLRRCRTAGRRVAIVSHKTEHGHFDPERVNLRQAALDWMDGQGFFADEGPGIRRADVFFEDSREAKLRRIAALGCTHFIDDLDEVLSDPSFPSGVERVLFGAALSAGRPYAACRNWRELGALFFPDLEASSEREVAAIACTLVGGPVDAIEPIAGGRNSRVFRVTSRGRRFALKRYPVDPDRDRLGSETLALGLMERHGFDMVPRVVASDPGRGFLLLAWIDGSAVAEATAAEVSLALVFLKRLHALAPGSDVPPSWLAAEACLSGGEIERQIRKRLDRLEEAARQDAGLRSFLTNSVRPAVDRQLDRARKAARLDFERLLPEEHRTLAPSDFGFHNALRRPDGALAFVDFEYFGWDDPVKLIADTLLHPGTPLGVEERRQLRAGAEAIYAGDPDFAARLSAYLPLFGLRWVLILLNEFLPERWKRRWGAGDEASWGAAKLRQLGRAEAMLKRAKEEAGDG